MLQSALPNFGLSTITVVAMLLLSVFPLGCMGSKQDRAIAKVGRHLERIHDLNYAYSLKKTTASAAAAGMYKEVEGIRKRFDIISDTAAIKDPLAHFLVTWTSADLIEASILNGGQGFMADVTAFYMRRLVNRREGWKTLFPAKRP